MSAQAYRNPQRTLFTVSFRNPHPSHRRWSIRLLPQFLGQFAQPSRPCPYFSMSSNVCPSTPAARFIEDTTLVLLPSAERLNPDTPCRVQSVKSTMSATPSLSHAAPSGVSQPSMEVPGSSPISGLSPLQVLVWK